MIRRILLALLGVKEKLTDENYDAIRRILGHEQNTVITAVQCLVNDLRRANIEIDKLRKQLRIEDFEYHEILPEIRRLEDRMSSVEDMIIADDAGRY